MSIVSIKKARRLFKNAKTETKEIEDYISKLVIEAATQRSSSCSFTTSIASPCHVTEEEFKNIFLTDIMPKMLKEGYKVSYTTKIDEWYYVPYTEFTVSW